MNIMESVQDACCPVSMHYMDLLDSVGYACNWVAVQLGRKGVITAVLMLSFACHLALCLLGSLLGRLLCLLEQSSCLESVCGSADPSGVA